MKRFLKNTALYFLVLALLVGAVDIAYLAEVKRSRTGILTGNVPSHIQVCNFGSSHGGGFDYAHFPEKQCYNFSLSAQTLSYDDLILQEFLDRIEPGGTAFLLVSYFSFFGPPETESVDFLSINKRYYSFLSPEHIKCYDRRTDFFVNYFPALTEDNFINIAKTVAALFAKSPDNDVIIDATSDDNFQSNAYQRAEHHVEISLDAWGKRLYCQGEIDALYEMIDLCRQNDITPVLVTTPFSRAYTDSIRQIDSAMLEDFYAVVSQVCEKTAIPYYDYSTDDRFVDDLTLFANSDHLNKRGAQQFTDTLLYEVLGYRASGD